MSEVNLIVIGKTGVGKSSFCNYIFGEELFERGDGAPVTGWSDHFKYYDVGYESFNLRVFDSVGIEANNLDKWKKELDQFIASKFKKTSTPSDWIHGAFYVINAASARIENSEIGVIGEFVEKDIPIQVVLSKSDLATEEQKESLIKQLKSHFDHGVSISEVCSVEMRTRKGTKEQYGKEKTLDFMLKNIDSKLRVKVGKYFLDKYIDTLRYLRRKINAAINESDIGFTSLVKGLIQDGSDLDMDNVFNLDLDSFEELPSEYEEFLGNLDGFLFEMGFESEESLREYLDDVHWKVERSLDDSFEKITGKLESIASEFEVDGLFNKLSATWSMVKVLADLKGFTQSMMTEVFTPVENYLLEEKSKLMAVK
ncbi:GTPase [Vibrio rotiferianus]|uniref:GTPase n=1 Tax=Vibrio rotiferianus TaxID=190895 RepID=UPI0015F72E28|nr:GTPase domain-containing protein [Vibrio rotiferianus]